MMAGMRWSFWVSLRRGSSSDQAITHIFGRHHHEPMRLDSPTPRWGEAGRPIKPSGIGRPSVLPGWPSRRRADAEAGVEVLDMDLCRVTPTDGLDACCHRRLLLPSHARCEL